MCRILTDAADALARLDAERLEQLASSCQGFFCSVEPADIASCVALKDIVRAASGEMGMLARLLEVTRINLDILSRLRTCRTNELEYGIHPYWFAAEQEIYHGDN